MILLIMMIFMIFIDMFDLTMLNLKYKGQRGVTQGLAHGTALHAEP